MSFFRTRSTSDLSLFGSNLFSPFRGARSSPIRYDDESPTQISEVDYRLFPQATDESKHMFTTTPLCAAHLAACAETVDTLSEFSLTDDYQLSELGQQAGEIGERLDFVPGNPHRSWENIPPDELNCAQPLTKPRNLRLGPLKGILEFYIKQKMQGAGLTERGASAIFGKRISNRDLINLAFMYGLAGIAWYLHQELEGYLPMRPEHQYYMDYKAQRRATHKDRNPTRYKVEYPVADGTGREIRYRPGIHLKFGKERDTIVRPMLTSVFRSNKAAFKSALLQAGLRYSELRSWKDSDLCTAIHIADSFKPGIWKTATDLHLLKCGQATFPVGKRKRND